jgi:long-chain acyl-CoA synthetase
MNLARILEESALIFGDRTAVIEGERQVSYAELNALASRAAGGLQKLGFAPGDLVGLCLPNGIDWLAAYFGLLKLGGAAVTMFAGLTNTELNPLVADIKPKGFIGGAKQIAELDRKQHNGYLNTVMGPGGNTSWEEVLASGTDDFPAVEREREDTAAVLFTGGTTGLPKGVPLSHENLITSGNNAARMERSVESDRVMCFLPLHHVFAQVHISLNTIISAGTLVLLPTFNMDTVKDCLTRHGITRFYAVPTIYLRLLELDDLKEKMSTVRYCFSAAASIAAEVVRRWKEKTGLDINEAYGMTETSAMLTYNHFYKHKIGSVGTVVGSTEVSIRDDDGNPVPKGGVGEVCTRGRTVASGYLNRPQETAALFHPGGWLRTGDLGRFDQEGHLFLVDRLKEMIITGGENVYPREVEEALYELPEVAECAVIGLPDPEFGELVTAVIRPAAGASIDPADMRARLKKKLSSFKVPHRYVAMDDLPKSAAGKVLKRRIKEILIAEQKAVA